MSGILLRWSRRKLAQAETAVPVVDPDIADMPEDVLEEAVVDEAALLEELGLPDPDTLTKGDDFAAFLRAAVPEALRRRALRRLWRSDPALACLDGLNDYDADYRVVSDGTLMRTAYRAGQGYAARAVQEAVAAATSDPPPVEVTAEAPSPPEPEVAAAEPEAQSETASLADPPGAAEDAVPRPRRMRFTTWRSGQK